MKTSAAFSSDVSSKRLRRSGRMSGPGPRTGCLRCPPLNPAVLPHRSGLSANSAIRQVLVPTDFSRESLAALEYACALAKKYRATVALLHVVHPEMKTVDFGYGPVARVIADEKLLRRSEKKLKRLTEKAAPRGRCFPVVSVGDPVRGIVEASESLGADLVVMASHHPDHPAHHGRISSAVGEALSRPLLLLDSTSGCPVVVPAGRGRSG